MGRRSKTSREVEALTPLNWALKVSAAPVPTQEGEVGGEDEEHPVAAHGEGEREVSRQTAPGEEVVDRRPVMGVQKQLQGAGASAAPGVHAALVPTHLYGDDHHQTRLHQNSEGLIVGDVLAVVPDRVLHGGPGDEEEDEGAVGAVHQTAQEGLLAEVHVQLAGSVELRILETPAVVHVLRRHQSHSALSSPVQPPGTLFGSRYLIKDAETENRERRVDQVVDGDEPLVVHVLRSNSGVNKSVTGLRWRTARRGLTCAEKPQKKAYQK